MFPAVNTASAQETKVHQWRLHPQLDEHERGQRDGGDGDHRQQQRRRPAPATPLLKGEDRGEETEGEQNDAGDVEPHAPLATGQPPQHRAGQHGAATIATGTLLHHTHRQLRASVKKPPMSGPTANATPPTAPQMPSTRPCFSLGKASCRIAIVAGIKRAAPVPWSPRPPMSCAAEPELATTTAASVYAAIPMTKMR